MGTFETVSDAERVVGVVFGVQWSDLKDLEREGAVKGAGWEDFWRDVASWAAFGVWVWS